jgi:predicted methyltransferase
MRAAALILVLAAATGACAQQHQHSFGDAQKWARVFDDPQRDAWQKPHEVIEALKLAPDAVVADIGAGTGYWCTPPTSSPTW